MGQYWYVVNLNKREFINPHRLDCGLKLWEQVANHPGTGAALVILCAAMSEKRGGGDLDLDENWHGPERTFPEHNITPGPMPEGYQEVAHRTIGRWAGDRIALVGDYAERSDLPDEYHAEVIYDLCGATKKDIKEQIDHIKSRAKERPGGLTEEDKRHIETLTEEFKKGPYKDITPDVARVIEHELGGKFEEEPWTMRHMDGTVDKHVSYHWKPPKEDEPA